MTKRIGILIPDGTGIRNYLYADVIKNLLNNDCEIILFHSISNAAIEEIEKLYGYNFQVFKIPIYRESYYQKFLRETICYARLLSNHKIVNNHTILTNWNPTKNSFFKKVFYKFVEIIGKNISTNYSKICKYETWHEKSLENDSDVFIDMLKDTKPAVIFSTHQRSMDAIPLVSAARQLKIKTVGAIFSWDNLPKARLTVKTDNYVVWSNYMKEELKLYYPEINSNNIYITGTPQFEFYYHDKYIIDKETFFNRYDLDPSKKIICFSGDDIRTSPYDPQYLEDLANVIQQENLTIQILLRRAPVDTSGRFDTIISKYPKIIKEAAPLWNFDKNNKDNWQVIYPKYEDIALLVSTAYYCNAVINVGSTMAHDFAMFNKPAIFINYNTVNSSEWTIETIYKFQHFKSMGTLNPVLWLNSKKEIKDVLIKVGTEIKLDNKEWIAIIAEHREQASLNIVNTLISCI